MKNQFMVQRGRKKIEGFGSLTHLCVLYTRLRFSVLGNFDVILQTRLRPKFQLILYKMKTRSYRLRRKRCQFWATRRLRQNISNLGLTGNSDNSENVKKVSIFLTNWRKKKWNVSVFSVVLKWTIKTAVFSTAAEIANVD